MGTITITGYGYLKRYGYQSGINKSYNRSSGNQAGVYNDWRQKSNFTLMGYQLYLQEFTAEYALGF